MALIQKVSSIGFSGAGFLLCYHLGVAKCFQEQRILPRKGELRPTIPLTGVSGGALVAAAVSAGIDPDVGMQETLEVSSLARKAGVLDSLQPGFSLVDLVHDRISPLLRDAVFGDSDYFLQRIDHGRLLRIGLTDRRIFPPFGRNTRAVVQVNRFRDVDDVIATCILSSYIPGVTGPALGSADQRHGAILKARNRFHEMVQQGFVVYSESGVPLQCSPGWSEREICWDGGLVNAFPWFDDQTIIVTPIAADFPNPTINPGIMTGSEASIQSFQLDERVRIHFTSANVAILPRLILSSEEDILNAKFRDGYDHAFHFLKKNGLINMFHSP